jgi:hypothetical protein
MSETDELETDRLLSPTDLHRLEPKFGLERQRRHREAGDFIPHVVLGNRVFYRESSYRKWLAEQEAKTTGKGQEAEPANTHALDPTLQTVPNTLASDDETRTRIAGLIGKGDGDG